MVSCVNRTSLLVVPQTQSRRIGKGFGLAAGREDRISVRVALLPESMAVLRHPAPQAVASASRTVMKTAKRGR